MQLWIFAFFLGVCSLQLFPILPKWFWIYFFILCFFQLTDFKRIYFYIFWSSVHDKFLPWALPKGTEREVVLRGAAVQDSKEREYMGVRSRVMLPRALSLLANNLKNCVIRFENSQKTRLVEVIKKCKTFTLAFLMGFCWVLFYAHWVTAWSLSKELENKNLLVTGTIASLPQTKTLVTSFTFATATIANESHKTKLKLSWYGREHPPLFCGDQWQLQVRLKRPHGTLNPGGFDYEKYLFEHHFRATGYIVTSPENKLLTSKWYHQPFNRLRQMLQTKMRQSLLQLPMTGIITTLVLGDESDITAEEWQTFRATGTSYLMAISGLHIGLLASIVFFVVDFLWRRSRTWALILPAKCAAAVAAFFTAFIYSALSGFSIPTQRAMIMLAVFLGAIFFRRNVAPWNAFFLALLLVLLIDPLAVLAIGFWLSFAAVAAIIYISCYRKTIFVAAVPSRHIRSIKKFLYLQFALTIALLPLTLFYFGAISFSSIIANIIAMPGVCLIVVPLSIVGALLPGYFGGWVLWLAARIMLLIWEWLEWLSHFTLFSWQHAVSNWWLLAAAIIGTLILLAPRGFPARIIGLVYFLPLILYTPATPPSGGFRFTLLDVGQGLASVIQTKHHTLIYDTGMKQLQGDSGTAIVIPFLQQAGIRDVAMMVVSHGDSDHIGGAASILKMTSVGEVYTSVPARFAPGVAQNCYAGKTWNWDGVNFKFLAPERKTNYMGNNASCVLKVTNGTQSVLLTGDIESDAEKSLTHAYVNELKSDIIIAPHHGSRTSSTAEFIYAVAPKYVLYPIGYRNRFHFPSKVVVRRYQDFGATMADTAASGAITFNFTAQAEIVTPEFYREIYRKYWND